MEYLVLRLIQLNPHSGLGLGLLLTGALFAAAVGVSVFSFYVDEYWVDKEFRDQLRLGRKRAK